MRGEVGSRAAYHVQAGGCDERPPTSQTQPSTAPLPYGKPPPPHHPASSSCVLSSMLVAPGWAAQVLFLQGQCPPQYQGSGLPGAWSSPKRPVLQPAELPEYQQCLGLHLQARPPDLESSFARRAVPMAPWLQGPLAVGGMSVAPWYCQGVPECGPGDIT